MFASEVTVAGSGLRGGQGEDYQEFFWSTLYEGYGGNGLAVYDGGVVDLRGNSSNEVAGGKGSTVSGAWGFAARIGFLSTGEIRVSGVALEGYLSPEVDLLPRPTPFQVVRGESQAGETRRLSLYGQQGATAFTLLSTQPALLPLPFVVGIELWLDPTATLQTLPFVLAGQEIAVNHLWSTPADPAYAGRVAHVQSGVLDPLQGVYTGTNPSTIVLGY